ncbi:MAG: DNA starvation/stationary phase protection protein Dps [Nostoc sp.]|uniref:DNA starvation/stationary phase protection protein Dps n=1 Tax=Nostoc sp. TaxID=1180 RepID=UPI002FF0FA7F
MTDNTISSRLYPTRIDIPAEARVQIVVLLNQTLAATSDLKTQAKQAHWNVKGTDFYQLHLLFDEIAGELEEFIDLVAERITALGGYAFGTVRAAASNSILPEYPLDILDGKDHVTALADRFASYGKHLREAIDKTDELGDLDTADLYTEISRTIDKRLWFLEAHLQIVEIKAENGKAATTKTQKTPAAVK